MEVPPSVPVTRVLLRQETRTVRANLSEFIYNKLKYKLFCDVVIFIANVTILVISFHDEISQPLYVWLIVATILEVLDSGTTVYMKRANIPLESTWPLVLRLLVLIISIFSIVWYILGLVWIINCDRCDETAPHLFGMVIALIVLQFFVFLASTLIVVCLACCLPVFLDGAGMVGAGNGATQEQLDAITIRKYLSHESRIQKDDALCVICLLDYVDHDELNELPCKHHFHKACAEKWLKINKTCPLCKRDISEGVEQQNTNRE